MNDASALLGQLAEEFTAQVRAGKLPAIEDVARQHPNLAERIRGLFPTLLFLEGAAAANLPEGATAAYPPPAHSLQPGQTFNQYRIEREIGRGGMGVVFEAVHMDRRLAARVDVADLVQETFLEAARRLQRHEPPTMPPGLWLRWLAREQVWMCHRKHFGDKRALAREMGPLPVDSSAQFVQGIIGREPSPSQRLRAEEAAERLRLALAHLDDEERDLILWRHFEQLANRDVARLLDIGEAAASKRYVRALERLRGILLAVGISG